MGRRIDALYSNRDDAKNIFEKKREEMKERAATAKKTIDESITEMMEGLKQRQVALHKQVDELLEKKIRMVNDQLKKIEEKKAEQESRLEEDEKTLKRLAETQRSGAPLEGEDKVAATGYTPTAVHPDWISMRIHSLTTSVQALRQAREDPQWMRLRDDEIISFKPKKQQELVEMVGLFGAVDGTSTYASESYAQGPLIEGPLKVGFNTWLLVRACDLHGRQRPDGGDKLICTWDQDADGEKKFEEELIDMEDGTYKLNVVPLSEGDYTFSLAFQHPGGDGSEPIKGSPFKVFVTAPTDYGTLGDNFTTCEDKRTTTTCEDKRDNEAKEDLLDDPGFQLRRPAGLQLDPQAKFVFVADQCNDRIAVLDVETMGPVCLYGKKGSGPKDLNTPGYIVVDREDQVIVTDTLNHRIQVLRFNRDEQQLRHSCTVGLQGSSDGQFSFPRGIALTQTGLLIVCDSGNHRIQVLDANKGYSFMYEFGSKGSDEGKFTQPYDVAVNSKDEILVTDSCHRIQIFNVKGKFLRQFGTRGKSKAGKFRHPTSITVDNEDMVFVCDQGNHRVQVFDCNGTFKHMWGGKTKKQEENAEETADDPPPPEAADDAAWYGMKTPIGITVSANGKVLVSDYDKHCVFIF